MPTVPTRALPTVTPQPISGQKQSSRGATPDAFGAAIGRATSAFGAALNEVADTTGNIALKMQIEANERDAKTRDANYAEEVDRILFGNPDAGTPGYFSLEGQAAIDAYPEMNKKIEATRRRILEGANGAVRRILNDSLTSQDRSNRRTIGRHVLKQQDVANQTASDARKATAASSAARRFNDPDAYNEAKDKIDSEGMATIHRKKLTGDAAKRVIVEGRTVLASSAFNAAMQVEDYPNALRIFKDNVDQIDGQVAAEMAGKLQSASLTASAQALVASAQAQFPGDEKAQLDYIKQIENGKLKDKAFEALREEFAFSDRFKRQERQIIADKRSAIKSAREDIRWRNYRANEARKQTAREARDSARDFIERGGSVNDIPRDVWNTLENEDQNHLRKRQEQIMSNAPIATDADGWELYDELSNMPFEKLKDVNLLQIRTVLGDREYRVIESRVMEARKDQFDSQNAFTAQQLFGAKADELGLDRKDKLEQRGSLQTMFYNEVSRVAQEKGKKNLSNLEMTEILNKLTDPIVVDSALKKGWQLTETSEVRPFQIEIPDADRVKIRKQLQRGGIRYPTIAQILNEYIRQSLPKKGK